MSPEHWVTPVRGSPPATGRSSQPCCTDSRQPRFIGSDCWYVRTPCCDCIATSSCAATLSGRPRRPSLDNAVRQRHPEPGVIFHADRGSQYTSAQLAALADDLGVRLSVGRKGQCWDFSAPSKRARRVDRFSCSRSPRLAFVPAVRPCRQRTTQRPVMPMPVRGAAGVA